MESRPNRLLNFELWIIQNSPVLGSAKGFYVHDPTASEIKCLQRMMACGKIYYSKVDDNRLHIRVIECFNVK